MSLYDLQQRTEAILKKYAQYDAPLDKARPAAGGDPFAEEYKALGARVDGLMQMAAEAVAEPNRAVAAARNAEVRKAKQQLVAEGVAGLQRRLKQGKGVTNVVVEERMKRVAALVDRIHAVPDGVGGNRRPGLIAAYRGGGEQAAAATPSAAGPSGVQAGPLHYKGTEETARFEAEWEASKKRQDAQLARIERGVGTLGDMARGMQEELDRQNPIIEDADAQLHRAATKLKSNNAKLHGLALQMRSKRSFCINIILACVVLGIVAYIVSMVQRSKQPQQQS